MASHICRWTLVVFAVLYLAALAILIIGTFGLFGQESDPLSGVFLLPLGLPWNLLTAPFPERVVPWVTAAAPLLNLVLLAAICRALRRQFS